MTFSIRVCRARLSLRDSHIGLEPLVLFSKLSVLFLNRDDNLVQVSLFVLRDLSRAFKLLLDTFVGSTELVVLLPQVTYYIILGRNLLP